MKSLRYYDEWTPEERAKWEAHNREQEQRIEAERAREAKRADERAVAALEIPPRILAAVMGELDDTDSMAALRDAPLLVCISGNPGCGKTIAAGRWLFEHRPGLFVKSAELARWDRYDRDEMGRLLNVKHLVVDDLGTEYQDAKGNFAALFDELVDHRYDHRLPLVMTTNLDGDEFKTRYGNRIADRIRESGRFVSIAGDSRRRKP